MLVPVKIPPLGGDSLVLESIIYWQKHRKGIFCRFYKLISDLAGICHECFSIYSCWNAPLGGDSLVLESIIYWQKHREGIFCRFCKLISGLAG